MTPAQVEMVRVAVASQRAKGIKLVSGGWGVSPTIPDRAYKATMGCACALGCLVLDRSGPGDAFDSEMGLVGVYGRAMKILGLNIHARASEIMVDAFTNGFDGLVSDGLEQRAWYEAGARLRAELKPTPKSATETAVSKAAIG